MAQPDVEPQRGSASAFQRLEPLLITDPAMPLLEDPDVCTGALPCGLRYYIKRNRKPEQRVALRLAVRAGSVDEEEAERGLAHMVEHLAFRATTNFDKLELVKAQLHSLEPRHPHARPAGRRLTFDPPGHSIWNPSAPASGPARMPTCVPLLRRHSNVVPLPRIVSCCRGVGAALTNRQQQRLTKARARPAVAQTSFDETVYMLTVPSDDEDLVKQSMKVVHEWATRIRISDEDVEGERGVVLEEWRAGRNAAGRMAEDYWKELVRGSRYADRMPIGLESVIRGADGATVRGLYKRLYRLNRMAAVIVGDFESAAAVLATLEAEFQSEPPLPVPERDTLLAPPPLVPVPVHSAPRVSCFEDAEATSCEILIECKQPKAEQACTAETLRRYIRTNLFADALNQRLYAVSKRDDVRGAWTRTGDEAGEGRACERARLCAGSFLRGQRGKPAAVSLARVVYRDRKHTRGRPPSRPAHAH